MSYKEIKKLLNELNCENVEAIKPQIIRNMNQLILSISDDNISDSELEEISNLIIVREEFREKARQDNNGLYEGVLINSFIEAYEEFLKEIIKKDYISDAIELIADSLKSIGGRLRGFRLLKKGARNREYLSSIEHFSDLKNEFYTHLNSYASKGVHEEYFVVTGLIHAIKFDLEEKSQEHGRFIISMLTDYKTKRGKSIDEFNSEPHLEEIKVKLKREYGIELQRRIYSWDNLTRKLQDHYYLENIFNEEDKE
ncbi:hypothetical protein [Clostridium sp.]|uniref:hypothetical protein n=1 Tax=Clostridium sp. TaxID=1506 RepID=UPI002842950D|nr:hypothetical protein [Clostridium sp.]MDR3597200.1 hypothetical protein [Clostridium sp.]